MRILGRVAARIPWELAGAEATSGDRRVEVLDALEDLYGTRDILAVREQIATTTAQGPGIGGDPTPDEIADARSWATRQLIERLTTYLCEPTMPIEPGLNTQPHTRTANDTRPQTADRES